MINKEAGREIVSIVTKTMDDSLNRLTKRIHELEKRILEMERSQDISTRLVRKARKGFGLAAVNDESAGQ